MPRADFRFAFAKRARYAEIDAQSVVFNSRYLEYLDIGITEYWRAAGMYDPARRPEPAEFHVARTTIEYRRPIRLDEVFDICLRCDGVGRSSMTYLFELHGAGADDLRARGETVSVHVDGVGGRPAPVPDGIVALFAAYEGRRLRA